jgi:hypothetical protein
VGGELSDNLTFASPFQVYNIETNTWKTFDDLPEENWVSDLAGFGDGSNAYFVGGYTSDYAATTNFFRIDVAKSMVQGTLAIEAREPLLRTRGDVSAVANEELTWAVITGGFTHENDFCSPLAATEKYDIANDLWTSLDDLQAARSDVVVVELDDHIFTMGGERQIENYCNLTAGDTPEPGELTIPVDVVEVLHIEEGGVWESLGDLEFHRFRFAAASFGEQDKFYTFGGQTAYNSTCSCFPTTSSVVVYSQPTHTSSANLVSLGAVVALVLASLAGLF